MFFQSTHGISEHQLTVSRLELYDVLGCLKWQQVFKKPKGSKSCDVQLLSSSEWYVFDTIKSMASSFFSAKHVALIHTLLNNRESTKKKIAWACDWYRLKAHIF